ncbi:MAG: hypothetical protein KDA74_08210 [Planctomycetaceae bacterium]|nr:hypothetical protein [Planctomycetaceae bacterium]
MSYQIWIGTLAEMVYILVGGLAWHRSPANTGLTDDSFILKVSVDGWVY